jgi:hypothetical protein
MTNEQLRLRTISSPAMRAWSPTFGASKCKRSDVRETVDRIPRSCGIVLGQFVIAFLLGCVVAASAQEPTADIGVKLAGAIEGARIVEVMPGSPAERAGLRAGDMILAVDNSIIPVTSPAVVAAMLRGPQGTTVRLTIVSPNGKSQTVQVVRALPVPNSPSGPGAGTLSAPPSETTSLTTTATGGQGMNSQGEVSFVNWAEPKERSFTVDVPQGWQVSGGVNWTGPIDAQSFVRVQSPDGKVQVFLGDPEILPRQVPSQWSRMQTGVGEGQVFRPPSGGSALMQRFLKGSEYAKWHATWRVCQSPRWVKDGDLPDLSRSITATIAPQARAWNATAIASAGEASFICDNVQGYIFATTVLGSSASGPIQVWGVFKVSGFVSSDPMRSMEARYVMEHLLGTFKLDPRWEQAYEQHTREVTGAVISMQNAATEVNLNAARRASDTLSQLNHPNGGVTVRPGSLRPTSNGNRDVCDAIGRCQNVSDDGEPRFIDHSGNVRAGRAGGAPPDNSGVWSPMYTRP